MASAQEIAGGEPGGAVQPGGEDDLVLKFQRLAREVVKDRLHDVLGEGVVCGLTQGRRVDMREMPLDDLGECRLVAIEGVAGELFVVDRLSGDRRPVAGTERLREPDLSPSGADIVAVRERGGSRELVIARLAAPVDRDGPMRASTVDVVLAQEDVQFNAPRWSPDGRLVVVERRRTGALPDIVLVDLGPAHPLLIFVEVVHTDGPVNDARKTALLQIAEGAGFAPQHVAFVTAYLDRASPTFRKTVSSLAWGSYAWFASEPDSLMVFSGKPLQIEGG